MMIIKSFILLFSLFSPALAEQGQDSWSVTLNGKKILATSKEEETKNVLTILTGSLKKKDNFIITYKEQPPVKDWDRFMALESADTTLKELKGKEIKISNASLQAFFKKSKTIEVYSWSLPRDPEMRMRVRIRRIHLCTLTLK